jgi:hypothetical protein
MVKSWIDWIDSYWIILGDGRQSANPWYGIPWNEMDDHKLQANGLIIPHMFTLMLLIDIYIYSTDMIAILYVVIHGYTIQ